MLFSNAQKCAQKEETTTTIISQIPLKENTDFCGHYEIQTHLSSLLRSFFELE